MDTIGKRLFESADMTGTLVSDKVDLNNMLHIGIHCVWTGTPAGDLFFEVSGELGEPTTWEVFDSVTLAGAGTQFWIDRNVPYRWARIRYVPTGSTGIIDADVVSKGDL